MNTGKSSGRWWAWPAVTLFINYKDISSLLLLSILYFQDQGVTGGGVEEIPIFKKKLRSALSWRSGGGEALNDWLGLFWGLVERRMEYETCLLKRSY